MKIDAHQHFWHYDPVEFGWIDDSMVEIRRSFLPEDLEPLLARAGYSGCVAVQAPQTLEETSFLLGLADEHRWIKGVVGWADLYQPDPEIPEHPKLKGLRHILQGQPVSKFFDTTFRKNLAALPQMGLTYDLLVYADQLDEAIDLAWSLPDVPMVLDHMAKPLIRDLKWQPWAKKIKKLAKLENIFVKISGLSFEADWATWEPRNLRPFIDHVINCFEPRRCMIGSDWPVSLCAGTYAHTMGALEECLVGLSQSDQDRILGGTAIEFYGL